ncbi:GNAT family N-acetyltransferase [Paenibacillus gorillae]|uniref:GNAT family N-acetyltransferase n=1 Tax=Paenibacillus gorillae TaxID=1243662 RepID=UPI0004B83793|nr:GNAT family N-acetyltransferase [Paenibacillus gorillae]
MAITARMISNDEDRSAAFQIRKQVFVDEQGVDADKEYDEFDEIGSAAHHVLVLLDGQPAATGRVRPVNGVAKLERICVLASSRGHGLGKSITEALEAEAKEMGLTQAKLNGQTHAEAFYARLGYETVSDIFMEEGIPHVTMIKSLI